MKTKAQALAEIEAESNPYTRDYLGEKKKMDADIKGNDSGFEKVDLPKDMVNQPSHYNYGTIECIDAIKGMLGDEGFVAYCRGNALKYTWRAGLKFDKEEDLKKASWYNRMAAGDDPREDTKPQVQITINPGCPTCQGTCRTIPCSCVSGY